MGIASDLTFKAYRGALWTAAGDVRRLATFLDYQLAVQNGPENSGIPYIAFAESPAPTPFTVHWQPRHTQSSEPGAMGRRLALPAWPFFNNATAPQDWQGCVFVRWWQDKAGSANNGQVFIADLAAGSVRIPGAKRVQVYAFMFGTSVEGSDLQLTTLDVTITAADSPSSSPPTFCSTPSLIFNPAVSGEIFINFLPPYARKVRAAAKGITGTGATLRITELNMIGSGSANSVGWSMATVTNSHLIADQACVDIWCNAGVDGYSLLFAATMTGAEARMTFECAV